MGILAEAAALDPLEELLGHDLVGVDVRAVEVADRAADRLYRFHSAPFLLRRPRATEDRRLGPVEMDFDVLEAGVEQPAAGLGCCHVARGDALASSLSRASVTATRGRR